MPEASLAMIDAGFNIDGSRISEQAHADARRGMKVVKAQY